MTTVLLLGLLFWQAASASATQQPATKATDRAVEKCAIAGVVVKATSGEPLKKAALSLKKTERDDPGKDVITDANGHFEMNDVEPGRYHLEASRNGYVTQEYGQRTPDSPGTILALTAGEHLLDISFRLMPAAAIAGHVYDEDGEPVTGAEVQALRFQYEDGTRKLMPAQDTQTNDLGEYRIFGLNPGHYYVSVSYNPGQFEIPEGGYGPRYYPGTDDPTRATPLVLRAGDDFVGTDFTLVPIQTFRVSGHVYDAVNNRPGVHAMVWLIPRDIEVPTWSFTAENSVQDPQGRFELRGVRPGSYYLFARSTDGDKEYTAREAIDVADTDIENVRVAIGPGIDLKGRIRVDGNAALNVNVLNIELRARAGSADMGSVGASIKPDGSFVISNVADGAYQLQVEDLPENFYLKAARLAGQDALRSAFTVSSRRPTGSLELVLSANGGRINGSVLKGEKPFGGARVVLVPEESQRKEEQLYKSTSTDQNGQFSIRGIAPGDYTLFAWENIEEGAYEDPDFLRAFKNQGKAIAVEEGSRLSSQLELIPGKTTTGQ